MLCHNRHGQIFLRIVPKKLSPPDICSFVSINDHHDIGALYARGGKERLQVKQPADGSIHIT